MPEESKVVYQSKDGKKQKIFDALEWIAAMPACALLVCRPNGTGRHADRCSHVPNKGEQMVRYGACPPLAELLQQRVQTTTKCPYRLLRFSDPVL
ncbi:MAG: hypothetical protein JRI39_10615 [Deltaproteobacteria bacterium]|nr:hypothetical protein [Deltaproteobacteria bacterium]